MLVVSYVYTVRLHRIHNTMKSLTEFTIFRSSSFTSSSLKHTFRFIGANKMRVSHSNYSFIFSAH